jgi:uncharacterized damage-inducible protein DinB
MPEQIMERPQANEYAPYYAGYISLVGPGNLISLYSDQSTLVERRLRDLPPERALHRYASDKWTVLDVLCHLIDTERVFTHRAVTFARGDHASLPSFEQAEWAAHAEANGRRLDDVLDEWHAQRAATVALVRGLPAAALERRGLASGVAFSVRALLHIPLGHVTYHLDHLARAYGVVG